MSGGATLDVCPSCGGPIGTGDLHCAACGAALAGPGSSGPLPPGEVGAGLPRATVLPGWGAARVDSGLLLLAVGLMLAWLPLISVIGGILILAAFILVWTAREACDPRTIRRIVSGSNLLFALIIFVFAWDLGLYAGLVLVGHVALGSPAYTVYAGVGALCETALGCLGVIQLVSGFADERTRRQLRVALGVALGTVAVVEFVPAATRLSELVSAHLPAEASFVASAGSLLFAVPYLTFGALVARVRRTVATSVGSRF